MKIALSGAEIILADTYKNAENFINEAGEAAALGADVICFPELSLTGATCGSLYFQEALTEAAEGALVKFAEETRNIEILSLVGLPIRHDGKIYNCMAAVFGGKILGISASDKTDSGFFAPAPRRGLRVSLMGEETEMGSGLVFGGECGRIFLKIGALEDAYVPEEADAVIYAVSEPEYVGLAGKRRAFLSSASERLRTPCLYIGGGMGESGTDGIYAAPRAAFSGAELICESELFSANLLLADIDLSKNISRSAKGACREEKKTAKHPFIPEGEREAEEAFELVLKIQSKALAARMKRAYAKTLVLGVSGGLDSTLALLAAALAVDELSLPRDRVIAITMPCFGTTERTKSNALTLAERLGCTLRTIDIKNAVNLHFEDISHSKNSYDVVYENAQARERTQILMDIANAEGGLVVGTGDLSELALGFATYNGDHMSMYGVNASVPKSLMRSVIAHYAKKSEAEGDLRLAEALRDIINTPVSPELLPAEDGENKQHTEKIVGPYELHDFFLYRLVKYGESPKRIFENARAAFEDEYSAEEIKSALRTFVYRFFSQQFKRSCLPDGPRVTEISLSPRGAWAMPSDCSGIIFKNQLEEL